ncbi:unnamed protein product, partial [marine sediment metagenome]
MLMIVRLYPKTDVSRVWNYVENEIKDENDEQITPLYATQSEGMMNVGIIFDVKEPDSLSKFITEEIVKCDEVHHTKTVSLMKPVFFPIPKKKPENIQRYVIRIYAHAGNGICHQVHLERFGRPGKTLLGSDSHTPTGGGVGMIAIGAGGLDVAVAMADGPFYLTCPK